MTTDTSEAGLERLICSALTGRPCDPAAADTLRERLAASLWMHLIFPVSWSSHWGQPHTGTHQHNHPSP